MTYFLTPFLSRGMEGNYLNDIYSFDVAQLAWTNLTDAARGDPPSGRAGAIFAAIGDVLFLFGGFQISGPPSTGPSLVTQVPRLSDPAHDRAYPLQEASSTTSLPSIPPAAHGATGPPTPPAASRRRHTCRRFPPCRNRGIVNTPDRKSTRLNSSHRSLSRMPSSA